MTVTKKHIKAGEKVTVVLPYSEVCMHLGVAGKKYTVELLDSKYPCAQIYRADGSPLSFPIGFGEAGIYLEDDKFYVFPASED